MATTSENSRIWFKSISLENVRSFGEKQTINFTDKDGNAARWNIILGDNGTGKTTVLKALCIAEENQSHSVSPYWFFRGDHARVSLIKTDGINEYGTKFNLKINVHREGMYCTRDMETPVVTKGEITGNKPLLFAYGAARR